MSKLCFCCPAQAGDLRTQSLTSPYNVSFTIPCCGSSNYHKAGKEQEINSSKSRNPLDSPEPNRCHPMSAVTLYVTFHTNIPPHSDSLPTEPLSPPPHILSTVPPLTLTKLQSQGASAKGSANPYLGGNFAPVVHEMYVQGLEVVGTLPRELDGIFIRNGPNPQFPPEGDYHWCVPPFIIFLLTCDY